MFKYQGIVENYPEVAAAFKAVTRGEVGEQIIELEGMPRLRQFTTSRVRYIDHEGLRYIEQNPRSSSEYARRARNGAKIMWVIRTRDDRWLGYVEDGKVYLK